VARSVQAHLHTFPKNPGHGSTVGRRSIVTGLEAIGEASPSEAVTNKQIPGINATIVQPGHPAPTTTEPESKLDPGIWAQTSAGGGRTCGLTTGGDAYCWGVGRECVGLLGRSSGVSSGVSVATTIGFV